MAPLKRRRKESSNVSGEKNQTCPPLKRKKKVKSTRSGESQPCPPLKRKKKAKLTGSGEGQSSPNTQSVSSLFGGSENSGEAPGGLTGVFTKLFSSGTPISSGSTAEPAPSTVQASAEHQRGSTAEPAPSTVQASAERHREGINENAVVTESSRAVAGKTKGDKPVRVKPKMSKLDIEEREDRTLFVGNIPIKWDIRRLRTALRTAAGDGYTGVMRPIWFRSIPLARSFGRDTKRREGNIRKQYADDVSDSKNAYVCLEKPEDVPVMQKLAHGLVVDETHKLRVDGVGAQASLQNFDRKRSVFVGGLPYTTVEADLREHFREVGEIDAVRIVRDKETSEGKGFAFVLFKERRCVKEALKYWGSWVKWRCIRVTKVEDQDAQKWAAPTQEAHPAEMRISNKKLHCLRKRTKTNQWEPPRKKKSPKKERLRSMDKKREGKKSS